MTPRWGLIIASILLATLVLGGSAAHAQPDPGMPARIAWVTVFPLAQVASYLNAFRSGLAAEGRIPSSARGIPRPATGGVRMTSPDDVVKTILRNKLLGRWAAKKVGMTGRDAEACSESLARSTGDPERSDFEPT